MSTMPTYVFTAASERLDLSVIHGFLTGSYWARGVDLETVRRSIAGSICFGILMMDEDNAADGGGSTVAFARVITDATTFAYLADVFVLPEHRGLGLGKRLVRGVLDDSRLADVQLWMLKTRDAHGLYRRFGFAELRNAERWMERVCTPATQPVHHLHSQATPPSPR